MKYPDLSYEQSLTRQGFSVIAGIDEVGRGCWAGPVVAAAIVFSPEITRNNSFSAEKRGERPPLLKIRDSKTLSKKQRNELNSWIKSNTIWAIGESPNTEIDRFGIGKATRLAMTRAVDGLSRKPDHLLIDGRDKLETPIPQQTIIDGDALVLSIAAASIIAKVYRDNLMEQFDTTYPGYSFSSHVGYGTKVHIDALVNLGPCDIHRISYKPIKKYIASQ